MTTGITGLVLAGGRAQRMGGEDKGLLPLGSRVMVDYVIERLRPQVDSIIINANRNLDRYGSWGWPVVSDDFSGFSGPLAGMAAGMSRAPSPLLLTAPCDSPLLPRDLGRRLQKALTKEGAEIAVARTGDRVQPVFALLSVTLLPSLLGYLRAGNRKIDLWYAQHRLAHADFSDLSEAFINVNTPDDRSLVLERIRSADRDLETR